jgi:hypothetical protein
MNHKIETGGVPGGGWAMPRSEAALPPCGLSRYASQAKPAAAMADHRGTLRPTFTSRTHKAPRPRGHRTYLNISKET